MMHTASGLSAATILELSSKVREDHINKLRFFTLNGNLGHLAYQGGSCLDAG